MAFGASSAKNNPLIKSTRDMLVWIILTYLRACSTIALSMFHGTVIGVAGSVGKSSARNALAAGISGVAPTLVVSGNSETGVPLGLLGMQPTDYSIRDWITLVCTAPFRIFFLRQFQYIIAEMGIDDPEPPKNMRYLLSIVTPDIGIIIHESAAHTMQFEKSFAGTEFNTPEDKLKALIDRITEEDGLMLLTDACKLAIINKDNDYLVRWSERNTSRIKAKLETFGTANADITLVSYFVDIKGTRFQFRITSDTTIEEVTLEFTGHVYPKALYAVFAPVFLVARRLGISFLHIKHALEGVYEPPSGRESLLTGKSGLTIIDSSYNASKPSVIAMLDVLAALKKDTKRPTVTILADMLELGDAARLEHEDVAAYLGKTTDYLYLVGALTKEWILPYLKSHNHSIKEVLWFSTSTDLGTHIEQNLPDGAIVLFKGSQGSLWLEEHIKLLLADKNDIAKLPRQNVFWKNVKTKAGQWIDR